MVTRGNRGDLIARGICVNDVAERDVRVSISRIGVCFARFDADGFMRACVYACEAKFAFAFA